MESNRVPTAHDHLCACGRRVMIHTTAMPCADRTGVCRECKGTVAKRLVAKRRVGTFGPAKRLG